MLITADAAMHIRVGRFIVIRETLHEMIVDISKHRREGYGRDLRRSCVGVEQRYVTAGLYISTVLSEHDRRMR
jgi:hypothetical protein